jgi:hypothetical protein
MAEEKRTMPRHDPLSFPFGALAPKKKTSGGGKRKLSAAQKATAMNYMKARRR